MCFCEKCRETNEKIDDRSSGRSGREGERERRREKISMAKKVCKINKESERVETDIEVKCFDARSRVFRTPTGAEIKTLKEGAYEEKEEKERKEGRWSNPSF